MQTFDEIDADVLHRWRDSNEFESQELCLTLSGIGVPAVDRGGRNREDNARRLVRRWKRRGLIDFDPMIRKWFWVATRPEEVLKRQTIVKPGQLWLHKQRRTVYVVEDFTVIEATWRLGVVYRMVRGRGGDSMRGVFTVTRDFEEFTDGRFELAQGMVMRTASAGAL